MFEDLVEDKDVVVGEGFGEYFAFVAEGVFYGCIHIVGDGVENADSGTVFVSPRELYGVDELGGGRVFVHHLARAEGIIRSIITSRLATDATGVKEISFFEQVNSFSEKGTIIFVNGFEGRDVFHLIVGLDLREIGEESYIEGEAFVDAVFQIQSTAERGG